MMDDGMKSIIDRHKAAFRENRKAVNEDLKNMSDDPNPDHLEEHRAEFEKHMGQLENEVKWLNGTPGAGSWNNDGPVKPREDDWDARGKPAPREISPR